jgi:acetyl/propionyl-CoA carboxylase alpha subunit
MSLHISLNEPRDVKLSRSGDVATLWIDGVAFDTRVQPDGGATELTIDGRREKVWVVTAGDTVFVHALGRAWSLEVTNPLEASMREGQGANAAVAPMPGVLVSLAVSPGDEVEAGQQVGVIESMKMQTEIKAPRAGVIDRVLVAVGDSFGQGAPLVTLEPEEEQ